MASYEALASRRYHLVRDRRQGMVTYSGGDQSNKDVTGEDKGRKSK